MSDPMPNLSTNRTTPAPPPRIDATLPPAEGIRRAILAQVELAEDAAAQIPLSNEASVRAGRVRRCRKSIKRARAILHLLRGRSDRRTLDRIDADLRDAGRRLSSQRDRDVRLETIARLLGEMRSNDPMSSPAPVPTIPTADDLERTDHAADLVQARMRDLEDRIDELPIAPIRWSWLRRRIATRWRRVRRRLRREASRGGEERLHGIRKACGRLEAQLMLFESMGDHRIRRRRKRISRVYETIGEDRDLALARATLGESEGSLRSAIDRRRRDLTEELDRRIGGLPRHRRRSWSMLAPPSQEQPPPSGGTSGDFRT